MDPSEPAGFNVLTGETGAGKSVIVEALDLALGSRARKDLVRTGSESGRITAAFDLRFNPGAQETLQALGLASEEPLLAVHLPALPNGRRRGRETASPSGLEGGAGYRLGDVFRAGRSRATGRGSIIHAWFEHIQWLDDHMPDDHLLRGVAARYDMSGLDVEALLGQFRNMLANDDVAGLLKRSAYGSAAKLPVANVPVASTGAPVGASMSSKGSSALGGGSVCSSWPLPGGSESCGGIVCCMAAREGS